MQQNEVSMVFCILHSYVRQYKLYGSGMQTWADVLSAYAAKRSHLEAEVKKYSDPPSDHLLPDLPPQVRYATCLNCLPTTTAERVWGRPKLSATAFKALLWYLLFILKSTG